MKNNTRKRLLAVAVVCLMGTMAWAQRVTFKANAVPLRSAVVQFKKATGYSYVLRSNNLDMNKRVTVNATNRPLREVVNQILAGQDVDYEVNGKLIIVKKRTSEAGRSSANGVNQSPGKVVRGTVTDDNGEPMVGATVKVVGTNTGAVTDINGNFQLNAPANSQLEISCVGYKTQTVSAGRDGTLAVNLAENVNELDETVVIGYGVMKKRDLTGSISNLDGKEIQDISVANPIQALQGRIPGVVITTNNGSPQGSIRVRVRGANSILGGNDPLYLVDGVPTDVNLVSTDDIESVEVLKDASATAIYGSRGANGVVMITTRSGQSGRTRVSYEGSVATQSRIKKFDMLNAQEYMQFTNIWYQNDMGRTYFTDDQIAAAATGRSFDWQDIAYRNATAMKHNVSVSGGNEKTKFYVSGTFNDREGIVAPGVITHYHLRANLSHDILKNLNLTVIGGYQHGYWRDSGSTGGNHGGSYFGADILTPPTVGPYNEDGTYTNMTIIYPFIAGSLINLVNYRDSHKSEAKSNWTSINATLTWKPYKDLTLKSTFGWNNYSTHNYSYTNSLAQNTTNSANVSANFTDFLSNENTATWQHDFGGHNVSVMGGFSYQRNEYNALGASGSGFISDGPESYGLASAESFGIPYANYTKWVLMSYLARATYSYKGRYLATATFRADGSSRYAEGNKWGYFPSFSLAWRISDEPFMKAVTWLDDLKLRGGFGSTGSTAISPYGTLNMLASGKTNLGKDVGTYIQTKVNMPSNLKWETTDQWDVGLDAALFGSRLRINMDWYYKNTRRLLNSVPLPYSTGYTSTTANIGKVRNTGFEFSASSDIFRTKDLTWTVSGNFAINKNKVTKLYGSTDLYTGNITPTFIGGNVSVIREGEPLGTFYTLKEDGYDEQGHIKYVDKNDDGKINDDDRFITGHANPDFTYGFTSDLNYKGWELSFMIQGTVGNDIFNVLESTNLDVGNGEGLNVQKKVLNSHWDASNTAEQNAHAKYPLISQNANAQRSDRFIEDGSYLRFKDIQLAYNLPVRKWGISWMQALKLYVSGQNLITITGYSGTDPEVNYHGNDSAAGIDEYIYPMTKSFTFGLKMDF